MRGGRVIANYGYRDGSGTYIISVDTGKCDGCGRCVEACPPRILQLVPNDYDVEGGVMVAVVEEHRNKLKYTCAPCKPTSGGVTPACIKACESGAITHSW